MVGDIWGWILGIVGVALYAFFQLREAIMRRSSGLAAKPVPGARRRLTDPQLKELERLLDEGAPAHGFPNELWTAARVAQVIQRHFGVKYHPEHVRKLLRRRLNWTSHKPQRRARQRNDKEVERWKADEFGRILRDAEDRGRILHAQLFLAQQDVGGAILLRHPL